MAMTKAEALRYRAVIEQGAQATASSRGDEEALQVSGVYPDWKAGAHKAGEVYNADGQTWYCYADYDNAVYPDITPGSTAWPTFNRPMHGMSPETARPWVQPTNAMDIYKPGEYMIWTDGRIHRCLQATNFSPAEYAPAWEVV